MLLSDAAVSYGGEDVMAGASACARVADRDRTVRTMIQEADTGVLVKPDEYKFFDIKRQ